MVPSAGDVRDSFPHFTVAFRPNDLPPGEVSLADLSRFLGALQSATVLRAQFTQGGDLNAPQLQSLRRLVVVTRENGLLADVYPIATQLGWMLYTHRDQLWNAYQLVNTIGGPIGLVLAISDSKLLQRVLGKPDATQRELEALRAQMQEMRANQKKEQAAIQSLQARLEEANGDQAATAARLIAIEDSLSDITVTLQQMTRPVAADVDPTWVVQAAPYLQSMADVGAQTEYAPDGVEVAAVLPTMPHRETAVTFDESTPARIEHKVAVARRQLEQTPVTVVARGRIIAMNKSRHTFTVRTSQPGLGRRSIRFRYTSDREPDIIRAFTSNQYITAEGEWPASAAWTNNSRLTAQLIRLVEPSA